LISKLIIKNFRCFQDFTLDNIRPVTLIAGANNAGKSTILESLFLFVDRYESGVFFKLNNGRGIDELCLMPKMVWEPLFANMNINNNISICVINDGELQTAIFGKDNSVSISSISPSLLKNQELGMPIANSYPLKLWYEDNTNKDISYFIITERGVTRSSPGPVKIITSLIYYISSKTHINPQDAAEWYSKVELTGDKAKCIEILKLLNNQVRDLSVILIGGIAQIFVDLGLASRLPINMLGDGILKLMHITLIMLTNPGAIILIDEIENGFHYSFYPKLWQIIGKLSTETKCQVFATTHSYECINGASILTTNADTPELFRFIRIDQSDGRIIPHIFDNDSFEYAVKNNWEIR